MRQKGVQQNSCSEGATAKAGGRSGRGRPERQGPRWARPQPCTLRLGAVEASVSSSAQWAEPTHPLPEPGALGPGHTASPSCGHGAGAGHGVRAEVSGSRSAWLSQSLKALHRPLPLQTPPSGPFRKALWATSWSACPSVAGLSTWLPCAWRPRSIVRTDRTLCVRPSVCPGAFRVLPRVAPVNRVSIHLQGSCTARGRRTERKDSLQEVGDIGKTHLC